MISLHVCEMSPQFPRSPTPEQTPPFPFSSLYRVCVITALRPRGLRFCCATRQRDDSSWLDFVETHGGGSRPSLLVRPASPRREVIRIRPLGENLHALPGPTSTRSENVKSCPEAHGHELRRLRDTRPKRKWLRFHGPVASVGDPIGGLLAGLVVKTVLVDRVAPRFPGGRPEKNERGGLGLIAETRSGYGPWPGPLPTHSKRRTVAPVPRGQRRHPGTR